jgi:chorismate mutase
MRILARTCLTTVLLGVAFHANAFQPVEPGLQPVHQQIRDVQEQIYSLASEFATNASMQFDRDELGHRIVQLMATRKALEVEVARAKALSHSSLINFVTSRKAAK